MSIRTIGELKGLLAGLTEPGPRNQHGYTDDTPIVFASWDGRDEYDLPGTLATGFSQVKVYLRTQEQRARDYAKAAARAQARRVIETSAE